MVSIEILKADAVEDYMPVIYRQTITQNGQTFSEEVKNIRIPFREPDQIMYSLGYSLDETGDLFTRMIDNEEPQAVSQWNEIVLKYLKGVLNVDLINQLSTSKN